jgi:cytochrome c oxidase subunit 1
VVLLLFEHLFWFLGHPEVYIVCCHLGITSEVIATNSRKPIFGYRAMMIMSILAIAFYQQLFGVTTFYIGNESIFGFCLPLQLCCYSIPAVKAFNYIHIMEGNLQLNPAMLFSIGLVSTFITGGLTGIFGRHIRY